MARLRSALDRYDAIALVLLLAASALALVQGWLADHPEHDPRAPLALDQRAGWATGTKLADLRRDRVACTGFLARSGLAAEPLPPVGEGECRRADRQRLGAAGDLGVALSPAAAEGTCAVDAALAWWLRHGVQDAAREYLGSRVTGIEHLGTVNCRRIGGGDAGNWSEHARGNAIDVAGFVLADGRRVRVRDDWGGAEGKGAFLHAVRDAACRPFATVLSPDYNAAHADHLHFDQAQRTLGATVCR